jgi:hypothetical protein
MPPVAPFAIICRHCREEAEMGPWLIDVRTRDEFEAWIGGDPPTPYRPIVMVVRGDSQVIREFIPNALDAAKLQEERVVVWLKDMSLLTEQEVSELFDGDGDALAAVLSAAHRPTALVHRDRIEVADAEFAFSTAR